MQELSIIIKQKQEYKTSNKYIRLLSNIEVILIIKSKGDI